MGVAVALRCRCIRISFSLLKLLSNVAMMMDMIKKVPITAAGMKKSPKNSMSWDVGFDLGVQVGVRLGVGVNVKQRAYLYFGRRLRARAGGTEVT